MMTDSIIICFFQKRRNWEPNCDARIKSSRDYSMLKRIANLLNILSEKYQYRLCNSDIFLYRDCFETVRELLKFIKPINVCDIGAHTGNWSFVMRALNPALRHLVIFEPQRKYHKKLEEMSFDGVEKRVYGCGVSDKEGALVVKGGTSSASFLDAAISQTVYFPQSFNVEEEQVEVRILDKIYGEDKLPYPDVIKLDVQGYELNVLKGATNILSKAKYLVIELSFREFYKGQPPLWELLRHLEQSSYVMVSHGYELRSGKYPSELLQMDGIFMNTLEK